MTFPQRKHQFFLINIKYSLSYNDLTHHVIQFSSETVTQNNDCELQKLVSSASTSSLNHSYKHGRHRRRRLVF
jgi:hypothetical protein